MGPASPSYRSAQSACPRKASNAPHCPKNWTLYFTKIHQNYLKTTSQGVNSSSSSSSIVFVVGTIADRSFDIHARADDTSPAKGCERVPLDLMRHGWRAVTPSFSAFLTSSPAPSSPPSSGRRRTLDRRVP